jgi:lipid-A-disaccharide synthase
MVVAYRMSWLSNAVINSCIRLGLIASRTVALPNLLMGSRVVPELLQEDLTAARLAGELGRLLDDATAARAMSAQLNAVGERVHGGDSVARVASLVLASAGVRPSLAEAV